MGTVFPCDFCGKELRAESFSRVHKARCPQCGHDVVIPATVSHARRGKHKILYVPAHTPAAGATHSDVAAGGDGLLPRAGWAEIAAGWIAFVVGVGLSFIFPHEVLVYTPFLVGAMIMGVRLIFGRRPLAGLLLLILPSIAAPILIVMLAGKSEPAPVTVQAPAVVPERAIPVKEVAVVPPATEPVVVEAPEPAEQKPVEERPQAEFVNGGFEYGMEPWIPRGDRLNIAVTDHTAFGGTHALAMVGDWDGWTWNEAKQIVACRAGQRVEVRARVFLETFATSGKWLSAGLKLQMQDGDESAEAAVDEKAAKGEWLDLQLTLTPSRDGNYMLLCFVCGGADGSSQCKIYFDDIRLTSTRQP
ncbi:MAG TPA: hypothetical protein PLE77_05885 [Kiritimatiellia bacterium]|nr:hypothetical protein [Kiritimatiellia bacterium]